MGESNMGKLIAASIIVMTGVSDYISDGNIVLKVSNGHELVSNWRSRNTRRLHVSDFSLALSQAQAV